MKKDGSWDIRVSEDLLNLFDRTKPYYFKVNVEQARAVVFVLSNIYGLRGRPLVINEPSLLGGLYGRYVPERKTIIMHNRNHVLTILHEFYHYLDDVTDGEYDSNDNQGGNSSFAWQFADKIWEEIRAKLKQRSVVRNNL